MKDMGRKLKAIKSVGPSFASSRNIFLLSERLLYTYNTLSFLFNWVSETTTQISLTSARKKGN